MEVILALPVTAWSMQREDKVGILRLKTIMRGGVPSTFTSSHRSYCVCNGKMFRLGVINLVFASTTELF
jgi:hypothetical protein